MIWLVLAATSISVAVFADQRQLNFGVALALMAGFGLVFLVNRMRKDR